MSKWLTIPWFLRQDKRKGPGRAALSRDLTQAQKDKLFGVSGQQIQLNNEV